MKKYFVQIIFSFVLCTLVSANDIVNFKKYSNISILRSSNITAISKDANGFIWLATQNELVRFDGVSYRSLDLESNKKLFSKNNLVQQFYFVKPEQLWICTNNGLFIYNIQNHQLKQINELAGIRVNSILIQSDKCYLNTIKGIIAINIDTEKSYPLYLYSWDMSQTEMTSLAQDTSGKLYLFSKKYLLRLPSINELEKKQKSNEKIKPDIILKLPKNCRMKIDKYDNIWIWDRETLIQAHIGANGMLENKTITEIEVTAILFMDNLAVLCNRSKENLIFVRDTNGKTIKREVYHINNQFDDLSNTTNVFYADEKKNIWLGTRDGLFMIPYGKENFFINIRNDANNKNSMSHNTTSDIYIENRNTAWVTTAYGINKINFDGNAEANYRIEHIFDNRATINHVLDNKIEQLVMDGEGLMWLGTKGNLKIYDPKKNVYLRIPEIENSLQYCSFVRALYRDVNNDIWIGFENGGVFCYNHQSKKIYPVKTQDGKNINCQTITGNKQDEIWIGSRQHGILRINKKSKTSEQTIKQYIVNDTIYQKTAIINSIYIDRSNNIWAGTNSGLYKYNYDADDFKSIPLNLFDAQKYIAGIIGDNRGNLWLATLSGIYKYNISEGSGHLISMYDGVFVRNNFVFGADSDSDGYIYMTGVNGLTIFNPNEIVSDTTKYKVFFTDFRVNNKSLIFGNETFRDDINYTNNITLKHKDNQFSFAFSALVYTNRENIQYAYMLKGVDANWIYIEPSEERYISYDNLPAGNYELKIRSTNRNGIWQDNVHSLKIRIKPPIWQTWYFYLLYTFLLVGLILAVVYFWNLKLKLKSQSELEEHKLKFYTDLSHSLKTPLTLLQSPLHSLIERYDTMPDDEKKYMLSTMNRNSIRLLHLVDQIGEFRKATLKKTELHLVEADFISFAKSVYDNFKDLFDTKGIQFNFTSNVEHISLIFDTEKMEIILLNLLSNAFKFTKNGGKVDFICSLDISSYILNVEINDNGIGIKKGQQEHVFERFYSNPEPGFNRNGIGLGLSLAKEFIELHHGNIHLTSSEAGTQINFNILLGNSHFNNLEIKKNHQAPKEFTHVDAYIESVLFEKNIIEPFIENAPLVYIADDDLQTSKFIEKVFNPVIHVKSFLNPDELYDEILKEKPKLIISSLVFKGEKSGFSLCEKIKNNSNTNDIPFVFVTSYANDEDKESGYESGADAYIAKPFDVNYLKKRVILLIQSKENIRERAKQELLLHPKEIELQSVDDKFLLKAMEVIEKHIDDDAFSVEAFASIMNLSPSMLYRKVKSLTNFSPNELIRSIRLKRAAQMLIKKAYSVSEVAEKVGFLDIRYFSSCFKKEFGVPPSVYSQSYGKFKNHLINK